MRVSISVILGWGNGSVLQGHCASCRWLASELLGYVVLNYSRGRMYWLCGGDGGW
jgi:hypothetical protein